MRNACKRSVRSMLAAAGLVLAAPPVLAADHGDAPGIASDRGGDINDCYAFLDPNDNARVVFGFTTHGFIPSGESVNFGVFDPALLYRINIENTGDAVPDAFITTRFSRRTSTAVAQTATVTLPNRSRFRAPATNPNLSATAPTPVITTDAGSGAQYFAGQVDDPFFFDIPAFSRFIASVAAGSPNLAVFDRARDSFAGYNTLAQAVSLPAASVSNGRSSIGVSCTTLRQTETQARDGSIEGEGRYRQVDRMGVPAVNVALMPFARKDAHNGGTSVQDANGRFDADITSTLNFLGVTAEVQSAVLDIVVRNGDFLRLDLGVANSGSGGGSNAGAGFPNGRRLKDDAVDILLSVLTSGAISEGDNVDASDVAPRDSFPFFGPSQQPREPGVIDDNTRN